MSDFDLTAWVEELDAALTAAEEAATPDPEVQKAVKRIADSRRSAEEN